MKEKYIKLNVTYVERLQKIFENMPNGAFRELGCPKIEISYKDDLITFDWYHATGTQEHSNFEIIRKDKDGGLI